MAAMETTTPRLASTLGAHQHAIGADDRAQPNLVGRHDVDERLALGET
jgi:hypothetical protein